MRPGTDGLVGLAQFLRQSEEGFGHVDHDFRMLDRETISARARRQVRRGCRRKPTRCARIGRAAPSPKLMPRGWRCVAAGKVVSGA
jgi:hypothetical protein